MYEVATKFILFLGGSPRHEELLEKNIRKVENHWPEVTVVTKYFLVKIRKVSCKDKASERDSDRRRLQFGRAGAADTTLSLL